MPWIEDDQTGELINLDDHTTDGIDEDYELDCGCLVAWNHGAWDDELSDLCPRHTFAQAVRIAETPLPHPAH